MRSIFQQQQAQPPPGYEAPPPGYDNAPPPPLPGPPGYMLQQPSRAAAAPPPQYAPEQQQPPAFEQYSHGGGLPISSQSQHQPQEWGWQPAPAAAFQPPPPSLPQYNQAPPSYADFLPPECAPQAPLQLPVGAGGIAAEIEAERSRTLEAERRTVDQFRLSDSLKKELVRTTSEIARERLRQAEGSGSGALAEQRAICDLMAADALRDGNAAAAAGRWRSVVRLAEQGLSEYEEVRSEPSVLNGACARLSSSAALCFRQTKTGG